MIPCDYFTLLVKNRPKAKSPESIELQKTLAQVAVLLLNIR